MYHIKSQIKQTEKSEQIEIENKLIIENIAFN